MSSGEHVDPSGAARDAPAFRVWPPVALGVPLAAGLLISWAVGEPISWPGLRVELALVLGGVFLVWNGWSLVLFRRHSTGLLPGQTTTELLRRGPYAWSRNPLYLGLVVLSVAIALAIPSIWALLLLPLGLVALVRGAVEPEEAYLRAKFGHVYDDYCREVPRWL